MTARSHAMPFGAQINADGSVSFRLCAPAAKTVSVCLEDGSQRAELPMQRGDGGWFSLRTQLAHAGSRYAYAIDGGMRVPDPASRFNPDDVHASSEVIDPRSYAWRDTDWKGRPWHEAVVYELHLGSFSPEGNYRGLSAKLDYLVELGVTAIEIMPLADFPGTRNWGYDGVLPFAPDASYGRPDEFKALIDAAHERGLMVFLDVVYNHFGPEGNYLHGYASHFFSRRHETPWGAAINFDDADARTVRDFFIHNALYWLEEYHLDGLRLDAVHAIADDSDPDIIAELAQAVRSGPGASREIHLILENDSNQSRYLKRDEKGDPALHTAQWNDDIHHVLHVLVTGERDGYYADYADEPVRQLARALAEGFVYQGEASSFRGGERRGEPSAGLPPTAFIGFVQTHDQVGNRAFGERIASLAQPQALRAALEVLLLAPSIPMLFMGEEFAAPSPFLFFCDFGPELAKAVTEGRRREFAQFARFSDPATRERIPDPCDPSTLNASRLDWTALEHAQHRAWLAHYRQLLALRRRWIMPRLAGIGGNSGQWKLLGATAFEVQWTLGDGSRLSLRANLGSKPIPTDAANQQHCFYQNIDAAAVEATLLPAWGVRWSLEEVSAQ